MFIRNCSFHLQDWKVSQPSVIRQNVFFFFFFGNHCGLVFCMRLKLYWHVGAGGEGK
jgi:hypothetical protein